MPKGENFKHFIKCFFNLEKPVTQTSISEQKAMLKYSSQANLIAEIGVFEGFNTREFALNSPSKTKIYAIDPFIRGSLGISFKKLIAKNEWRKNNINNKIIIIEGFSFYVADKVENNLDFIFVDGDHSLEAVKKDFELYSKKLSTGGKIAFHDARVFANGWTTLEWGPVRFINENIRISKDWKIVEEVDSLVVIERS